MLSVFVARKMGTNKVHSARPPALVAPLPAQAPLGSVWTAARTEEEQNHDYMLTANAVDKRSHEALQYQREVDAEEKVFEAQEAIARASGDLQPLCGKTMSTAATVLVMGGQGGSGTRGVWQFLQKSGACHMVRSSPDSFDSFGLRSTRLIRSAVTLFLMHRSLNFTLDTLHPALEGEVHRRFCRFESRLAADLAAMYIHSPNAVALAIKEPLTMYLVPVFQQRIRAFKFLHLTRDVRTISKLHMEGKPFFQRRYFTAAAHARIQEQLRAQYAPGDAVWSDTTLLRRHMFIRTWADTQSELRRWAAAHLAPHEYFHLRVEDLYVQADPAASAAKIHELFAWLGYVVSDDEVTQLLLKAQGHGSKYVVRPLSDGLHYWVNASAGHVLRDLGYAF